LTTLSFPDLFTPDNVITESLPLVSGGRWGNWRGWSSEDHEIAGLIPVTKGNGRGHGGNGVVHRDPRMV